jgi:hypothetical protein
MSNDKLFTISNSLMLYCGIIGRDVLTERREEPNRRYLKKEKGKSIFRGFAPIKK